MSRLQSYIETAFIILLVLRSATDILEELNTLYLPLVPLSVSPSAVTGLLILLTGLIYLGILFLKDRLVIDRVGLIFLAWVLSLAPWVYLSAYNFGMSGLTGVYEWVRLLTIVVMYVVTLSIAKNRGYQAIVNAILLALPIPLTVAYYELYVQAVPVQGTTADPAILASFLVLSIGLTLWKLDHATSLRRIFWGLIALLQIPILVATAILTGWIMMLVFLVVLGLLSQSWGIKIGVVASAVLLVVILILFSSVFPRIGGQIKELAQMRGYEDMLSPTVQLHNSVQSRINNWYGLFTRWKQRPLVGYGLNTSMMVNPRREQNIRGNGTRATWPHNDYLRYLVECGVFGLFVFLLFLGLLGREIFRMWTGTRSAKLKTLCSVSFALYVSWAIGSISGNLISYTVFQVYLWALLAAISAHTNVTHSSQKAS